MICHKKLLVIFIFAVFIQLSVLQVDSQAGDNKHIPAWALKNVSALEKATAGLGSTFLDDPSYILWKPSLVLFTRRSNFSVSHLNTEIRDKCLCKTDVLAHRWEKLDWGLSAAILNRKVDNFHPVQQATTQNIFSFGVSRRISGFGDNSKIWWATGLSKYALMENHSRADSASISSFLGFHNMVSWKDIFSLGLDLYGPRWGWEEKAPSDSNSKETTWENVSYNNVTLHLGTYFTVPAHDLELLDRNLLLSWGIYANKDDKPKFSYGCSYRLALKKIFPEKELLLPLSISLSTGYREYDARGYGINLSYNNYSLTYAYTSGDIPKHYIGFTLSFGSDNWEQRKIIQERKRSSKELFSDAKRTFRKFLTRKYYSCYEFNKISSTINMSAEKCESECDTIYAMKKFIKKIGDFKEALNKHFEENQYDNAEIVWNGIDSLIFNYTDSQPSFTQAEKNYISTMKSTKTILDSIKIYSPDSETNVAKLRKFYLKIQHGIDTLQQVVDDIYNDYSMVFNIPSDSIAVFLEKVPQGEDMDRLTQLSAKISALKSAQENIYPYFIIVSDSQKLYKILPTEHLNTDKAVTVGMIKIRNNHSTERINDINISIICDDRTNMWFPESQLVNILPPGISNNVHLKAIPLPSFYSADSTIEVNTTVRVSYTLDEKLYIDKIDSLPLTLRNSRLIRLPIYENHECIPYFTDPEDSLIKRTKNFISQSLSNMTIMYPKTGDIDTLLNNKVIVAMATMNFIADNVPAYFGSGPEKLNDQYIAFSKFDEIFSQGPKTSYEKAVFTTSILRSMDIPCYLSTYRNNWLILIDKSEISALYKKDIFSKIDSTTFIPIAMRLKRDRFFDAVNYGKELISNYNSEQNEIKRLSNLKTTMLEIKKDGLLARQAFIDSVMNLVSKPYKNGFRESNNPYMSETEEMNIRLKLAYILDIYGRKVEVQDQFVYLLCLDDTCNWFQESGMMRKSALQEWETAKKNYKHRCFPSKTADVNRNFIITKIPAGTMSITFGGRYDKYSRLNLDPGKLHSEYNKLKQLEDFLNLQ